MKNILILKPLDCFYTEENGTSNPQLGDSVFSYSLGVLTQVLRNSLKIKLQVIDPLAEKLSEDEVFSEIKRLKPDYIFSNVNAINADWIKRIGNLKKSVKFKFIALINKPFPEETVLKYKEIDGLVHKEWIWTSLEILKSKNIQRVLGIYVRKGKKSFFTGIRKHIHIDNYPIPAYDLFPMKKYKTFFSLWSDGCSHRCLFCPFGSYPPTGWEHRSIDKIIKEIKELMKYTDIRPLPLFVMDNETTNNPKFVKKLCKRIIEENLDIVVDTNTRASTFDEELAKLMVRAGIINLGFGIESGIQKILNLNNKDLTLEQIENTTRLMKKYKIIHRGYIMIGMWGDTRETIWKTYDYVKNELKIKNIGVGICIPYPNTPFFQILKRKGYIKHLSSENVKWVYKNVYGYRFIEGKGIKPSWKINEDLDFDDLVEIYREMKPKLSEFNLKQFIFYRIYHNPSLIFKWGKKFLRNPFIFKNYI